METSLAVGVAAGQQASNDVRHQSKATRLVTSSAGIKCPFNKLQEKQKGRRRKRGAQAKKERERSSSREVQKEMETQSGCAADTL